MRSLKTLSTDESVASQNKWSFRLPKTFSLLTSCLDEETVAKGFAHGHTASESGHVLSTPDVLITAHFLVTGSSVLSRGLLGNSLQAGGKSSQH